ncbi:hypothetical protein ROZALSC1DRAFT_25357 [Rozella allomycis CSF55]|uniref:Uncharacterized protein n=1 Tax=Rozella allomycis (strain CSF55) TaxID=988480 RepID=A0A4P9YC02_ROZAC|nr:hypothetical protein ROZALSC1DRAFT_25357 [Rozella allomycis CSF55]
MNRHNSYEGLLMKGSIEIDVVGIKKGSNGRSCSEHEVCGNSLEINQILVCEYTIILSERTPRTLEEAVVVRTVVDGAPTCKVGYLKGDYKDLFKTMHGRLIQVTEIHEEGRFAHKCCGWLKAIVIK